jgi:hypothetical protein
VVDGVAVAQKSAEAERLSVLVLVRLGSLSSAETPKSTLKSLSADENHGISQPIRRRYGSTLSIGARRDEGE